MVKKVALDTLEIEEQEIALPEKAAPVEEAEVTSPARWRPPKRLWISALVFIILIIAGVVSYWLTGDKKSAHPLPGKGNTTAMPLKAGPPTAKVNDFIVTLKNDKGGYLVLSCDLTFELAAGQETAFQQNLVEVRRLIYEILQNTRHVPPSEPKIRNGLREEINKAVSGLLGQNTIKAIYFTKFVVL